MSKQRYGKTRRAIITLSNGTQSLALDSQQMRLARCRKRIKAWSATVPRLNRKLRRAYKANRASDGTRMVLITLTYRDLDGWQPNDIREYLLELKACLKSRLWAYSWVCEMQSRGCPHYHIIVVVPTGTFIPLPDTSRMWLHGSSNIKTATSHDYLLEYTSKPMQKEGLPYGARMFGIYVQKKDNALEDLYQLKLSAMPGFVAKIINGYINKKTIGYDYKCRRNKGGGWLLIDVGELLQSEWHLVGIEMLDE
jgi:hypothetical protein